MSFMDRKNILDEGFFSKLLKGLKKDKSSSKVKKDKSKKLKKMYDDAEKEIDKTRQNLIKQFKEQGIPIPDYLK